MKLVIHGNVKQNKNNKRIGRNPKTGKSYMYTAKSTDDYMTSAIQQLKEQFKGYTITEYPITIQMAFYYPTRHRKDLDNSATTVLDCLTKAGVIKDDDVKYVNELYVFFGGYDKESPRCEIFLED